METKQLKFELHGVTYRIPCVIDHHYDDASDGRCYQATCEFGGRTFEAEGESETLAMFNLKRKLMEEIERQHQRELAKLSEWNTGKAIAGER